MKTNKKKQSEAREHSDHTPTPWETDWSGQIRQAGGEELFIADFGPNEPNAAFIVRAVNSHEELLAAARKAFDVLREASFVSGLIESQYDDALKSVGEAIAKAEGK